MLKYNLFLGESELSWGFESTGRIVNNGEYKEYGKSLNEKDVVGAYLVTKFYFYIKL